MCSRRSRTASGSDWPGIEASADPISRDVLARLAVGPGWRLGRAGGWAGLAVGPGWRCGRRRFARAVAGFAPMFGRRLPVLFSAEG
ncbi:MAG: hypothetical protein M3Y48_14715 [Actinomycetota bacterium]|nr:hypothetical protein [Actinomycetota bacterium]